MKSKEEILEQVSGLTIEYIKEHHDAVLLEEYFMAMDAYADQFRKWRTDPPPKDGSWFIAKIDTVGLTKTQWNEEAQYFECKEGWFGEIAIKGWIPVPE